MKTATIPAVRVEPELRDDIERLLCKGESLSQFVEDAVRTTVQRRRTQTEFVARGMKSLAEAKQAEEYFDAGVVMRRLRQNLEGAKARQQKLSAS